MKPSRTNRGNRLLHSYASRRAVVGGGATAIGGGALALSGLAGLTSYRSAVAVQSTPVAGGTPMPDLLAGLPLTPEMAAVLRALLAFGAPPSNTVTPAQARQLPLPGDAVVALLAARGENPAPRPVAGIHHAVLPGPTPEGVLVRVYRPVGEGPFPVVVYFHGGGWTIASLDAYDASARALTNAAGAIVVSVAYRQAPENPFPAAMDDAYAATQWVLENAAELGGDPARVAVAGESAGGNLAAVSCLRARDEGGLLPVHQLLVYPITNYAFDTPSYEEWGSAYPLNQPLMDWFWDNYLEDEADGEDPYASPLQAEDFSGLPPATVVAAQVDPLTSEGLSYADALAEAGVDVQRQEYAGVTHEFFGMAAVIREAQQAVDFAAQRLQEAFGGGQASPAP